MSDFALPVDPRRFVVPMGCTAMINYNVTRSRKLLQTAQHILKNSLFPKRMRRGDQEAIWLAWTNTTAASNIRITLLPDEYYCYWNKYNTKWKNQHRIYNCYALHNHGYTYEVLKYQSK